MRMEGGDEGRTGRLSYAEYFMMFGHFCIGLVFGSVLLPEGS